MSRRPDDICPRFEPVPQTPTEPFSAPLIPTAVWRCESTQQAEQLLAGDLAGYVYQRDGHPNADIFAAKCRELHRAERAAVVSSGMAAMALALLTQVEPGGRILVSNQLYGRTSLLFTSEARRLGCTSSIVDPTDLAAVQAEVERGADLLVVETISNPMLRVADIRALAEIVRGGGERRCRLLVDNTFATPVLCQPLTLGADLVVESVTKLMNGHGDVMLGVLCGPESLWGRTPLAVSAWGLACSPFDAWLATRGLVTLALRSERASNNAMAAAKFLSTRREVLDVHYPGLPGHPDHQLAARQFGGQFGAMVSFRLAGGRFAADAFIRTAEGIPFCPSLGDAATTLSHPLSTSHRGLSEQDQQALGIDGGVIRLSVGIESAEQVIDSLSQGLSAL